MPFLNGPIKRAELSSSVLPGTYTVAIANCVESETKNGLGVYLRFTFSIQSGKKNSEVIDHYIIHKHQDAVVEKIGQKQLGTLMDAVNLTVVHDASQFIGLFLTVDIAKGAKDIEPRIKKISPANTENKLASTF